MKFNFIKKVETYSLLTKQNIFLCLVFVFSSINSHGQVYNFSLLRDRVYNSQNVNIASSTNMDTWISTQNANGSWPDLKYGTLTATQSVTNNHVTRLWNLAAACSKTGNIKYNNATYKDAIKRGLQFWYTSNTIDPNWWFNKILFPQKLGELLIFMRVFDGYIPKTTSLGIDEPEIISLFSPTTINDITYQGTGANAIDIGLHYVYRGLLTDDGALLSATKNKLESILAENIVGDLIYQDHGPQIMTASYGWVFCDGLIRLASFLSDSPAAFDTNGANFGTVLRFIRETQISSTRGKSWDFSALGRGVSRLNGTTASMNYLQTLADNVDPANKTAYLDALSRLKGNNPANYKVREFNKHYWASDYTQHARQGYLFTVRNTSTRTVEAEKGNGENLKANYFSYGANFISVDGSEYTNIMPVWDWSMIPGTTFPYTATFPSRTDWGTNYAVNSFVGGVSDGVHGASVLNLTKSGIQAKKSWFFFNDEIVCLGAGITYNSTGNVRTTINQAWMNAASYSCAVGSTAETTQNISSSTYNNNNLKYIRNNKIAYYFPNQGNVNYTMKSQSGTWNSINSLEGTSTTQSGNVFSLWLDHGNNPNNASYSYIVVPGVDSKIKAQTYDASAIEIILNTSAIQAVFHKKLDILQVVFHQAGTVNFGNKSVTVDYPCALMFKNGSIVTLADPFQIRSNISVSVKVFGTNYTKIATLPSSKELKGSSVSLDFGCNTATTPLTTTGSVTTSICAGSTYHWDANNTDYTTTQLGVTSVFGCNTATLNLTVTPPTTTGSVTTSICAGSTYHWDANNTDYTTAQTGLTYTVGCNTATLNLTVTPKPTTVVTNATICSGSSYTWVANGLTYNTTQTAITITNDGCTADQVLNLTVTPAPKAGTNGSLILNSTPSNATLFAALTGADAGGTWTRPSSGYVGVYTYTVAATSPCTVNSRATITVTDVSVPPDANTTFSFCPGTKVSALLSAYGTGVNAYATVTGGVALGDVALTGTTAKPGVYFLSKQTVNGESATRVRVSVIINALPATPSSVVLTNEAISSIIAVTSVGLYAGTNTPFKLTATAVGAVSYKWTLPTGVVRTDATGVSTNSSTTSTDASIYVKFTQTGVATPLVISVQSINASGCTSLAKPSAALTRLLPAAPSAIVATDTSIPVASGKLPAAVKSFAKYMGTNTVLTLTATPSPTATSYEWELPAGVTQLSGGTSNQITVNFAGVTKNNTDTSTAVTILTKVLRIGVKSVNGVGSSVTTNATAINPTTGSTAKLLTLLGTAPAAPTLALTSAQTVAPGTKPVAMSAISGLLGQNEVYKLIATVSPLASSYVWNLPGDIVSRVAESGILIADVASAERFSTESTEPFIYVKFNKTTTLPAGTSVWFGVKAQNGIGLSDLSISNNTKYPELSNSLIVSNSLLKLALSLPTVGTITGKLVSACANGQETYTIAPSSASSYVITAPVGTVVTSPSNSSNATNSLATTDRTFTVKFNNLVFASKDKKAIVIKAKNQVGNNILDKSLLLTTVPCAPASGSARLAVSSVADNFDVTAYPNPSTEVFRLEIQSSGKGKGTIGVQVYDIAGRLIEQCQLESNSVEMGNSYPTGIYTLIINQGENTKTLRLIKK